MLYLSALVRKALGLPPPHVHHWQWGEVQTKQIRHRGEGGDEFDGEPFDYNWPEGRCSGCGMVKMRRVW